MRRTLMFTILVLLALVSMIQGLNNAIRTTSGSKDFQWGPSREVLQGRDPYTEFLATKGARPYFLANTPLYPASGSVFLVPYAAFPWRTAKALWALSSLPFTALVLWCLSRLVPGGMSRDELIVIGSLFVAGTSWRNGVGNGQQALFCLAFFLLAVVRFGADGRGGGLALAVSWFKYSLTFPLTVFFARTARGRRTIATAAGIHVGLTAFLVLWTGASPTDLLLGPVRVARMVPNVGHLDVFAVASRLGHSRTLVPAALALTILGLTCRAVWRDDEPLSCLSTLAFASVAVLYHRLYDFVVLVIPLTWAVRDRGASLRAKAYLTTIGALWFLGRSVELMVARGLLVRGGPLWWAHAVIGVGLFYGTLGLDLFGRREAR